VRQADTRTTGITASRSNPRSRGSCRLLLLGYTPRFRRHQNLRRLHRRQSSLGRLPACWRHIRKAFTRILIQSYVQPHSISKAYDTFEARIRKAEHLAIIPPLPYRHHRNGSFQLPPTPTRPPWHTVYCTRAWNRPIILHLTSHVSTFIPADISTTGASSLHQSILCLHHKAMRAMLVKCISRCLSRGAKRKGVSSQSLSRVLEPHEYRTQRTRTHGRKSIFSTP